MVSRQGKCRLQREEGLLDQLALHETVNVNLETSMPTHHRKANKTKQNGALQTAKVVAQYDTTAEH